MGTIKIGVREFRERIATYLESGTPIAVTRRGETLGVYVPTPKTLENSRPIGTESGSRPPCRGAV